MSPALPPGRAGRTAMTLMEVMVASVLMVTAVFAGFGAMGNAHLTNQRRLATDRALALVQNEVEIYQALDDASLQSLFSASNTIPFGSYSLTAAATTIEQAAEQGTVTLVDRTTTNTVSRYCLLFRVAWVDSQGPCGVQSYFHFTERR